MGERSQASLKRSKIMKKVWADRKKKEQEKDGSILTESKFYDLTSASMMVDQDTEAYHKAVHDKDTPKAVKLLKRLKGRIKFIASIADDAVEGLDKLLEKLEK